MLLAVIRVRFTRFDVFLVKHMGLMMVLMTMLALMMQTRLRVVGKTDLVLMIMGVSNEYLIDIHDNHKCEHCNDHGQRQVTIGVKIAGGSRVLARLVEIEIKVVYSLGDDVK
jgi:hypothetical protein